MVKINDLGIRSTLINKTNLRKGVEGKKSFENIFQDQLQKSNNKELKISAHAETRMRERGIELTETNKQTLIEATDKAAAKGSKECLIMLEGNAFVVSVPNRTVITAVDSDSMRGNVFTNIDSAILNL